MPFAATIAARLLRREGASRRGQLGLGLALAATSALALAWLGEQAAALLALVWLLGVTGLVLALVAWLRPMLIIAVLGLAIGVARLFVVLGVSSGVERELVRAMARLNGHALVGKYGLDFYEYDEVAARLDADPRIRAASPFVFGVGMLVPLRDEPDSDEAGAALEPRIVTIKGLEPVRASAMSGVEALFVEGSLASSLRPAGPRELAGLVVGVRLARRLDLRLGDRVRIVVPEAIRPDSRVDDRPHAGEFELLGLIDSGFAEFDESLVLVHITAAQALVYGQLRATGIELELEDPRIGDALPIAEELVAQLDEPRTSVGRPPHYRADSWFERSEQLTIIRQSRALLVVVLGLIVLVASSSLVAALLILIRGKRHHIGVFSSLGARPRQIFWSFELVGLATGLIGASLGLALGGFTLLALDRARFGLDPSIYMVDRLPVAFVLGDLVIPSVLALAVCGVVSGPVARAAARLRPLEMLR
jgi:lipoprotein-releasing system permease protein